MSGPATATGLPAPTPAPAGVAPAPAGPALGPDGQPWRQYLCRVCGLVYDEARGDADSGLAAGTRFEAIPEDWACPICGVGKADFELMAPAAAVPPPRSPRAAAVWAAAGSPVGRSADAGVAGQRRGAGTVVVGAGRAGWQVVQALRQRGHGGPITLVTACSGDVYDKPQISVALARALPLEALVREPAAQAAQRLGVQLLADTHAVAVDAAGRRLRTTRGTLRWRHLVLAQGAAPALPPSLPPERVWCINDLAAYRRLRARLAAVPQRLLLVGAGLVGCELANDLALAGHAVTLLDRAAWPLAALLPPEAGQALLAAWAALPIQFLGGVQVAGLVPLADSPAGAGTGLRLADGRTLWADQVLAATGLRTPGRLADSAGLVFDQQAGGIVVAADTGATSVDGIHALGDCVVVAGRASRFIAPIAAQAEAIACAILGLPAPAPPPGQPPVLRVKTSSLPITLARLADDTPAAAGAEQGAAPWQALDGASGRRLARHGADGRLLATLQLG